MVYLDNNATTQIDPRVIDKMLPYINTYYGNSASLHAAGQKAYEAVEAARQKISLVLKCSPDNIYFTSTATEANNIILKGRFLYKLRPYTLITSPIEHSSIISSAQTLERYGCEIKYTKINSDGTLDLDYLTDILKYTRNATVSLMGANNEIGTINNLNIIGGLCKKYNAFFHTDCSQLFGKYDIDTANIDAITLSSHKIYGPKGVGALYIKDLDCSYISPLIDGGLQETITSGTINVANIVGFGRAAELMAEEPIVEITQLRDYLLAELSKNMPVKVNGTMGNRLYNNLNISITIPTEAIIQGMDDVIVSGAAACRSKLSEPSYVLKTIGADTNALRFGLGRFNTKSDIDYAVGRIIELWQTLQ